MYFHKFFKIIPVYVTIFCKKQVFDFRTINKRSLNAVQVIAIFDGFCSLVSKCPIANDAFSKDEVWISK